MTADDDAAVRSWAAAKGIGIGTRGRIPAAVRQRFDAAHLDAGDAAADDDAPASVPDGGPPPDMSERRPRPVAAPGPAARLLRRGRAGRRRPAARRHPRVPVDDLIAGAWHALAQFARPLPPTSRLLHIQAPVAGLVLEDVVRGTIIDRAMQPFARAEKSGQALFALLGPPAIVTAMTLSPDAVPMLIPLLRQAMLGMCKVMGPKMKEALAAEKAFEEDFGADIDLMIRFILNGAVAEGPDPVTPEEADAAGVRHMRTVIQGQADRAAAS